MSSSDRPDTSRRTHNGEPWGPTPGFGFLLPGTYRVPGRSHAYFWTTHCHPGPRLGHKARGPSQSAPLAASPLPERDVDYIVFRQLQDRGCCERLEHGPHEPHRLHPPGQCGLLRTTLIQSEAGQPIASEKHDVGASRDPYRVARGIAIRDEICLYVAVDLRPVEIVEAPVRGRGQRDVGIGNLKGVHRLRVRHEHGKRAQGTSQECKPCSAGATPGFSTGPAPRVTSAWHGSAHSVASG